MLMEELVEGVFRAALRALGFIVRALIWMIWELFFGVIGWYAGWPVCRVVSLGRLPREGIAEYDQASRLTALAVTLVGLVSLVGVGAVIALLLQTP